ncbi:MAG: carbon-nitrogen hydrolase family protein [Campylobacterales bacterium]|nr:carbon-nitrogen hydrolase family protein [Campylobacterales bacterium]
MNLVALQFSTDYTNFKANLEKLESLIDQASNGDFIVAPELCLTGYSYDHLEDAANFSLKAIDTLKELSQAKIIALTLTLFCKDSNKYTNTLHIFHKSEVVYTQHKAKLFTLNDEDNYFKAGNTDDFKIIEIDGIKIASLICFELRFIDLWEQSKGADIIIAPSMWGILRKQNFESLTNSLAIMNQCYVIASDSSTDKMASSSGVINPFGIEVRDDQKEFISMPYEAKEIKKMRRYLSVGIH